MTSRQFDFSWLSGEPFSVIAEIGINHNGSAECARELISAASTCGASAVKFQYRNLARSYISTDEIGDEIIFKEIKTNFIEPADIIALCEYGRSLGLKAGVSFFNVDDISDFTSLDQFDFFKVPSVELCNLDLIDGLVELGKPILLSLGCHSESEIKALVAELKSRTNSVFNLFHCVSNYPVHPANSCLGYISYFKERYGIQVGFSSHEEGWIPSLIAATQGAPVIERHITLDRSQCGLDHSSSSTPAELAELVSALKLMPQYLSGAGPRRLNQGEIINRQNLGRSFYAKKDLAPDTAANWSDFEYRSPQVGIGWPERISSPGAPVISTRLRAGDPLVIERNLSQGQSRRYLSPDQCKSLCDARVSLPVRLHDYDLISKGFGLADFEFHLSFGEVEKINANKSGISIDPTHAFSIHLPDYISSTLLLDPESQDEHIKRHSRELIASVSEWAKFLQDKTGKPAPVVGSFSVSDKPNCLDRYRSLKEMQERYSANGVTVLPQWLPPYAWYFGGSVPLNMFNDQEALDIISSMKLEICLDLCHFQMGRAANNFSGDTMKCLDSLLRLTRHIHLAMASGPFDEGGDFSAMSELMKEELLSVIAHGNSSRMVIEVWQGHLRGYEGFYNALTQLSEIISGG